MSDFLKYAIDLVAVLLLPLYTEGQQQNRN